MGQEFWFALKDAPIAQLERATDFNDRSLYVETHKVENPNSVNPVKWRYRAEPILGDV